MNIIVTGASRGIGKELVLLFAQNPENKIFIISRNSEKLELLSQYCKKHYNNQNVIPIAIDLSDIENIFNIYNTLNEQINCIDILVNNAGYLESKNFEDIYPSVFDMIYKVNVAAPFELIRSLLPLLNNSKTAHVVNISSMGGFQGSVKFAGLSAYASSKAAIASLTECLAEEYKDSHIKFNCLALGAVATEMLAEAFPGYEAPTTAEEMAKYIYNFSLNGYQMFNGKILPVSKTTP